MQRRHTVTVLLTLLLALAAALPVWACVNDRDTLAMEGKNFPGLAEVITGRFERNPPLYYEMRVARVAKELAADPSRLDLYDDIAAALDRLGRSGEAIAWMERKRARLAGTPEKGEDWYRYHANVGTFKAHRWLHDGADRKRIGEMKAARAHIAKAIRLKPDAHFGREKYQLLAMDWIIEPRRTDPAYGYYRSGKKNKSVLRPVPFTYLFKARREDGTLEAPGDVKEKVTGLSGLIVLGAAWESVDVFEALADLLPPYRGGALASLAQLRTDELRAAGRMSLLDRYPRGDDWNSMPVSRPATRPADEQIRAKYSQLRADAEAWQRARTEFMTARLRAGKHPDTHPDFWNGYEEKPAIDLEMPYEKTHFHRLARWLGNGNSQFGTLLVLVTIVGPSIFAVGLASFFASRAVKRRLRARRGARVSGGGAS